MWPINAPKVAVLASFIAGVRLRPGNEKGSNMCAPSQLVQLCWSNLSNMAIKYYTQFLLTDAQYVEGNEFSGVVELSTAPRQELEPRYIEGLLANKFELDADAVQLISWARLH